MARLLERLTAWSGIVFFSCGIGIVTLIGLDGDARARDGEGYLIIQVFSAIFYVLASTFLILRFRSLLAAIRTHWPVLVLAGYTLATVLWSVNPGISLRRSVAIIGTTLFALFIRTRLSRDQFLDYLAFGLGLAAVASFLLAVVAPSVAIMDGTHQGSWRGIFQHKNNLGWVMTIATVIFYHRVGRSGFVSIDGVLLLLAGSLVLLSGSRTSWLVSAAMVAVIPAARVLRSNVMLLVPGLIVLLVTGAIAAVALINGFNTVVTAIGRDPTLTGRTVVWALAIEEGMKRFWTGAGFGAFWLGPGGASMSIWETLRWDVPHGHNAYLDVWLELGMLGVIALLVVLLRYLPPVIRCMRAGGQNMQWIGLVAAAVLLLGLSADVVMKQNSIIWLTFLSAIMYSSAGNTIPPKALNPINDDNSSPIAA